ncbi:DegT/DnrJ/EryC1/StrS family aminotransferase [Sphingomonas sp. 28-63-12]|uniref:DegT/DnrJ/EryC1/StrS family aminotransferase n=1 Tax=Sphingomonas sp. 28-63-12 TaxID=1970434 RepID=UPI000BD1D198|nr:MAG: aminotransferase DegT [Sphingomonas sp. 28-63-12]
MSEFPLIAPRPPRLSEHGASLRRVEQSGIFSNNGPEVRAFEAEVTAALFGGHGASLAVANATLGLMIAIREAAGARHAPGALALMPSFTFAATGQAALWAGLTPLICDIDPYDWGASAEAEQAVLDRYGDRIAVVVPYATFGNAIDLDHYARLRSHHGVGIVVDAAASLGTIDRCGMGFGAQADFAIVHSMHATKTFAVAEGGLIHSGDPALIARLRSMTNFGFEGSRSATLPGINAKLPEILALMARTKLAEIEPVCTNRAAIEANYRTALREFSLQHVQGQRRASQFMPVLLPPALAGRRDAIIAALASKGVGAGCYFSPHLAQQPLFKAQGLIEPTPVADAIAARIISLPITDAMRPGDAIEIAGIFADICAREGTRAIAARARPAPVASVMVIGGGPAGTALLTAATKRNLLPALAQSGLVIVERDAAIGGGRLGGYAITSDSTATTFLSAVKDNGHAEVAALADHPVGRAIRAYPDNVGVPLVEVGPLLRAVGDRLAGIVTTHGGTVLTGHDAISATLGKDGLWTVRLRRQIDGATIDRRSQAVVIATGGHQPAERLATQQVAGVALAATLGDRLVQSDEILSVGGLALVAERLKGKRAPNIVVIGGSTSALATIALLLKEQPALPLGAGAITLLHRRTLRPFYPSPAAALAEGFTDFGPDDICPVSGFVYRLAGFRLEARDLVQRMLAIDGRSPEPRVQLHCLAEDDDAIAAALLHKADLVIAALGYRPHALPLFDAAGNPIALAADTGAAMVDKHCRVTGADGAPVSGVYGIGLAAGFVPWGAMGGEPSFRGQANGLWQWQNDVGLMIVEQLLGERARARAVA